MTSRPSHEEPEHLTIDVDEPWPGVLVAGLTGWLDLATAPDAEARLRELLETHAPRLVVLDLSRTEFLGSAGVAVLLRLRRGTLARGCGPPCLVGLTACARRTLLALGLLEMFTTADDVAALIPDPLLSANSALNTERHPAGRPATRRRPPPPPSGAVTR